MDLFDSFLQERTYLKGVSKDTLRWYQGVRKAFAEILTQPTKSGMLCIVQRMLARGLSAISVNTYLRGFRTYINWLHQEGHLAQVIKVPLLKTEQKIIQTLCVEQVRRIIRYSPNGANERRVHTFVCLCLDTGLRLSEGLSLTKESVDFDNLVIKVKGKGNKHRLVPFSIECRKILYRFASRQNSRFIFSTRTGTAVSKRNLARDMDRLGVKLGFEGRFSPHVLRHTFACEYLKRGGNLEFLRRILGHSSILTTQKYLRSLGVEDLQAVHDGLSLLSKR